MRERRADRYCHPGQRYLVRRMGKTHKNMAGLDEGFDADGQLELWRGEVQLTWQREECAVYRHTSAVSVAE